MHTKNGKPLRTQLHCHLQHASRLAVALCQATATSPNEEDLGPDNVQCMDSFPKLLEMARDDLMNMLGQMHGAKLGVFVMIAKRTTGLRACEWTMLEVPGLCSEASYRPESSAYKGSYSLQP